MDKHTTWLAYLWAVIAAITSYFSNWTINDWGALVGIVLAIATFFVNRYYKHKAAQTQKEQVLAMEKRNRILAQIALKLDKDSPYSTAKALVGVAEQPEGNIDADADKT
ncbi:TPA: alpha/beta hydrolase [Salmonella enterica subsp. enterica serovar Concord]|nr:alpha/beta hydrolase [Salmonella enterica subsp. enterica serovar Concord]